MSRFVDWLLGRPRPDEQRAMQPWDNFVPFVNGGPDLGSVSQERALSLWPVFAANRLLANTISTLPLDSYRVAGDVKTPMTTLPTLFQKMEDDGTLVPWLHKAVTSLALRGNAFGLITQRDGFGYPTRVTWLDPSQVTPDDNREGYGHGWYFIGRPVDPTDIIHIPWFSVAGWRLGLSPIAAYAKTLGIGLGSQDFALGWFNNGGIPPGTFQNTENEIVDPKEADAIKQRLISSIRNRAPIVYGKDWEYTPLSVTAEEAQFVQTQQMTATQIAAIYGIPPEMIGGDTGKSLTYTTTEQHSINFAMFSLRPWLVALESAFSAILPNKQYVRFDADELIRADLKSRWEVNFMRVTMGAASIDEIRAEENLAPLPNGQGQVYQTPPSQPTTPNQPLPSATTGDNVVPMRRDANE